MTPKPEEYYNKPSEWLNKLLSICCPKELYEQIRGDLEEIYEYRRTKYSKPASDLIHLWEVISTIKLRLVVEKIPSTLHYQKDHMAMFSNYFKIAYRNIIKHKAYSFINISGLAIGLTCFMLIFLWIRDEVSYDSFHDNSDRIAKVGMTWVFGETQIPTARATTFAGPGLKDGISYVQEFVRLKKNSTKESRVNVGGQIFNESMFFFADSSFFDVFSFELLYGNPNDALTKPNSIILTKSTAEKYFRNTNVLGKTLIAGSEQQIYQVTGIVEDVPENSHIQFDILASFSSLPEAGTTVWNRSAYHTYLLLNNGNQINLLQEDIDREVSEYFGGRNSQPFLTAIPFKDVYLKSPFNGEIIPGGDIRYVYIFSGIAFLIVIIACINYMNLATARASDRAKEVGMRKTLGAYKNQLIGQFMGETVFITLLGLFISILAVTYLTPFFNDLTGKELSLNWFENYTLLFLLIAIGLGVSFLSGSYPAFMLSRFEPARVLKGSHKASSSGLWLRKGLVVVQFCISIMLIVSTLVIYEQLDFIQNKKLGYTKEQVLTLSVDKPDDSGSSLETLKQELTGLEGIFQVSLASHLPIWGVGAKTFNKGETEETRQIVNTMEVDEDFLSTMEINLVAGSNITPGSARGERMSLIINEAAAELFGWSTEEAIDQELRSRAYGENTYGKIYGVVENFNYESLHKSIEPLILVNYEGFSYSSLKIIAKIQTEDLSGLIPSIENTLNSILPETLFEYSFLDDEFNSIYNSEQQTGTLFSLFATIAIFIACLGLFGLASFAAVQRSKEIGIRKVLGATVTNIVLLISYDFAKLILIAIAISLPVSWLAMNRWLDEFAYQIQIGWQILLLGSIITVLIAWLTIGFQSVNAARVNPIENLKSE